jgi:hypothetical protein
MIAALKKDQESHSAEYVQERFLAMLPLIRQQATIAFRRCRPEAKEELVQEVIANCYRTWCRLVEQGKDSEGYATPLANFAIRQVHDGRRIGGSERELDILSRQAQRRHGFAVEPIHRQGAQRGVWDELLVEDRKAGPAETAAARLDFYEWLKQLSKRNRQIAKALSVGETTSAVSEKFALTAGRVSQLRVWLRSHWELFQGERQLVACVG